LGKAAGIPVDDDDNFTKDFMWEDSYKIGLPREHEKEYLCFFEDGSYDICSYDDENTTPCFWDRNYSETVFPLAWADISGENPLNS
jgi:hypothetical protein